MARKTYNTYRCGGYSSYSGHCGATDCETCHPGGARAEALEEATSELRAKLEDLTDKMAGLEAQDIDEDTEGKALLVEIDNLDREIAQVSADIEEIESGFDGGNDEPDYDRDDHYDDGNAEVNWESPY